MTGIAIVITLEEAWLAADTQVTVPGGENWYTSKVRYFPNLMTAIAGTGSVDIIHKWLECIEASAPVNILELDDLAEEALPHLLQAFEEQLLYAAPSTTIYHVGVNPESGHIMGRSFKSLEGFAGESMPQESIVMRPSVAPPAIPLGPELLANIIALQALSIRGTPEEETAGIGGEIEVFRLRNHGVMDQVVGMPMPDFN